MEKNEKNRLMASIVIVVLGISAGALLVFFGPFAEKNYVYDAGNNPKLAEDIKNRTLGKEFQLDLEQYRKVDQSLIKYNESGRIETGFSSVYGLAIDKKDNLYASGNTGVKVINSNNTKIAEFNTVTDAYCVDAAPDGMVFVGLRTKVKEFKDGKLVFEFGKEGSGRGEFKFITSVKAYKDYLFVADAGNRRVYHFDMNGKLIKEFARKDEKSKYPGLLVPGPHLDMDIDRNGNLWIANTGMLRLEKYSLDGRLISFWGEAGEAPEKFSGCCNPVNFVISRDGNIITGEKAIPRVKIYSPAGKFLGFVAPPEIFDSRCKFMDLAVDSLGKVYAVDDIQKVIRIFQKK